MESNSSFENSTAPKPGPERKLSSILEKPFKIISSRFSRPSSSSALPTDVPSEKPKAQEKQGTRIGSYGHFKELLKNRKSAEFGAKSEAKSPGWGVYNSPAEVGENNASYHQTFEPVFPQPFSTYLQERKQAGKGTYVMDLMGPGQPLRELPIDKGLAVTLGDSRTDQEKQDDKNKGIDVLGLNETNKTPGDVLSKATWKKIGDWLQSNGKDGFDLVLCRPVGGLLSLPKDYNIEYWLVNNAWKTLSKDDGTLLLETNPRSGKFLDTTRSWISQLQEQGIDSTYGFSKRGDFVLKFTRQSNSPENLPTYRYALPEVA